MERHPEIFLTENSPDLAHNYSESEKAFANDDVDSIFVGNCRRHFSEGSSFLSDVAEQKRLFELNRSSEKAEREIWCDVQYTQDLANSPSFAHFLSLSERIDEVNNLAAQTRLYEVGVEALKLFATLEKPKLTLTYGDAIHVLKKCKGQIFSKYFQETFQCKVDEGIDILEVGLWDSHRFTSDELVGSAKVQLHNVTSENFHHFTTPLFSNNGRLVGEIQLKIRLVEASMQHSIMPLQPSVGLTRPSVLPDGLPDLRGTEIPSTRIRERIGDLYEFNLESYNTPLKEIDPYISMKYGDVVYNTKKSTDGATLMEFLDSFVCKADKAIKVLDVDLWKRHRIIPDELVGSAKIELDSVTSGAFCRITSQLFSKDKSYVGEVELKVRWVKPSDVNHPLKTYNKKGNFLNCTKQ